MNEGLVCYYEPFNEQLGALTLDTIGEARPETWRSRHPQGAPYVLEYAGILAEGGGVEGFPRAASLGERYIGGAGLEGALDDDVAAYLAGLIAHARQAGKVPTLAFTRSLGRVHGIRASFGGYHILLLRNLFHQWNSYAGQARFGNWYFFQTLFETLEMAPRDAVIGQMAAIFPPETRVDLGAWVARENFDRVFCYFVGFHLYFQTAARRSVDLVVDTNAMAQDVAYRTSITTRIGEATGIYPDFSDATQRVDFPIHPLAAPQSCMTRIKAFARDIEQQIGASDDECAFITELIEAVESEQASFSFHAAAAFEYLEQIEAELRECRRAMNGASSQPAEQAAPESAAAEAPGEDEGREGGCLEPDG